MNLTDEALTELETKAKAALEVLPPEHRGQRWHAETATHGPLGVDAPSNAGGHGYCVVEEDGVGAPRPALMRHLAAADPHAVLALVSEVRALREKVKTEGNAALKDAVDVAYREAANIEEEAGLEAGTGAQLVADALAAHAKSPTGS